MQLSAQDLQVQVRSRQKSIEWKETKMWRNKIEEVGTKQSIEDFFNTNLTNREGRKFARAVTTFNLRRTPYCPNQTLIYRRQTQTL